MSKIESVFQDTNVREHFLVIFFLTAAIIAVYGQAVHFDFVKIDDPIYVTHNKHVQQGLTWQTFLWSFTGATWQTNYWVPLTWLSVLLDYQLYGLNAGGYHLTNILLHILNTWLLYIALNYMTAETWRSALVAALFAVHPLHVESVAWITERKDVLSSVFWILTLLSYAWYTKRPGVYRYALVFLCLLCGLMSKPMLVTLPFALLLLDFWPLGRADITNWNIKQRLVLLKLVIEKLPFFMLIAVFSVLAYITQAQEGAVKPLSDYPAMLRAATVPVNYVFYIIKMIWPTKMAYMYPYPQSVPAWHLFGAVAMLAVTTFGVLKTIRSFPYAAMGWFWYLGTLVPVIGIVVIGPYAVADRYTYISFLGLFIMISWGIPDFLGRWNYSRTWLTLLTIAVLLLYSAVAWVQVGYWRDNETLSRHAIEVTRDNLSAYLNLGVSLQEEGKYAEASALYFKMLEVDAENISAYKNLGVVAKQEGRFADAIQYFQQAIHIDPQDATIYNNLGNTYAANGRPETALASYEKSIKLDPEYSVAYFNAGNTYLNLRQLDRAMERYQKALALDPLYAEAHNNMGGVLALQGHPVAAMGHFYEALRLKPDFTDARKNLEKLARRYRKQPK